MVERVLFAVFWIPTTATLTWALSTIYGLKHAPFYYSILLCLSFYLYSLPRRSSLAILQYKFKASNTTNTTLNNDKEKTAKSNLSFDFDDDKELDERKRDEMIIAWVCSEGIYIIQH